MAVGDALPPMLLWASAALVHALFKLKIVLGLWCSCELYRPFVTPSRVAVLFAFMGLSTCLTVVHSKLIGKGPEENADGNHDHHSVIIIASMFTIIGFGSQGGRNCLTAKGPNP